MCLHGILTQSLMDEMYVGFFLIVFIVSYIF